MGIVLFDLFYRGSALLQSEDGNDGQDSSTEASSGLSSSGSDDGSLGSGGHKGRCALGNTRHTS